VRSVFSLPLLGNPLTLWGVALEVVLLLVANYVPWANALLATLPVPMEVWLLVIPFALGMLVAEEVRKAFVRRWSSTRAGEATA
jgi:hypothetical protein